MTEALEQNELSEQQKTFGLFFIDYVRLNQAEIFLSHWYQECVSYPLMVLYFVPENQVE